MRFGGLWNKEKNQEKKKKRKKTYFNNLRPLYADNFAVQGDMMVSEGEIYGFWPLLFVGPPLVGHHR